MNMYLNTILESTDINEEDYKLINSDTVYSSITEEVSIPTTPEQARVVRISENEYAIALSELSDVASYLHESGNHQCDELKALKYVCNANKLQLESMVVVIPNQKTFESFIESCMKEHDGCPSLAGKLKAKSKIQTVVNKIQLLKENNIQIKKSKY